MNELKTVKIERRASKLSRRIGVAAIVLALLFSLVILKPAAPDRIILLTGPEGSAYHEMGKRLGDVLESRGLETTVEITDGGLDNLERLASGGDATIAFAPSNSERAIDDPDDLEDLVSLGSVAWEPLWLFTRAELGINDVSGLAGVRVVTGAANTALGIVATDLLRQNDLLDAIQRPTSAEINPENAVQALLDGDIDAVFASGTPSSPAIRHLLEDPRAVCFSVRRAAAYAARVPGIAQITVPEGVVDLAENVPDRDLVLLSGTTNLVTHDSVYPGAVPLVLKAITEVADRTRFTIDPGDFPNPNNSSLPIARAATRYYDRGETGLSRFLPYKVTRWLNHLGFVVLPLLTVVAVMLKVVPMGLKTRSQMQLVQMLKTLERVEKAHAAGADKNGLIDQLNELDHKSERFFVPRATVHDYIDIRQFLHDMRERVAGDADTHGE